MSKLLPGSIRLFDPDGSRKRPVTPCPITTSFVPGFDKDNGFHPKFALLSELGARGGDLWGVAILLAIGFLIFRGAAPQKRG